MAFGGFGTHGQSSGASRPMSDINVTPLVDVMLVLVVIFILTAPLLASAIRLDLPHGGTTAPPPGAARPAVKISIDAAGQVYLDDAPQDAAALAARLAEAAARDPATEVQLRADAAVPYGQVVAVMDAAQKAGLSRIGFVAQPPEKNTP